MAVKTERERQRDSPVVDTPSQSNQCWSLDSQSTGEVGRKLLLLSASSAAAFQPLSTTAL